MDPSRSLSLDDDLFLPPDLLLLVDVDCEELDITAAGTATRRAMCNSSKGTVGCAQTIEIGSTELAKS